MGYTDDQTILCQDIPAADVSEWLDLGELMTSDINSQAYGPGEFIVIQVTGYNLTLDPDPNANPPQLEVWGRYTDQPSGLDMMIGVGPEALLHGGVVFALPSNIAPSIRLNLKNLYTGRWSARVIYKAA
jgi:hypothetical protein